MAFSIFFFASSRCSAGDPVSLVPEADDKPLVRSDGLNAMVSLKDSVVPAIPGKVFLDQFSNEQTRRRSL